MRNSTKNRLIVAGTLFGLAFGVGWPVKAASTTPPSPPSDLSIPSENAPTTEGVNVPLPTLLEVADTKPVQDLTDPNQQLAAFGYYGGHHHHGHHHHHGYGGYGYSSYYRPSFSLSIGYRSNPYRSYGYGGYGYNSYRPSYQSYSSYYRPSYSGSYGGNYLGNYWNYSYRPQYYGSYSYTPSYYGSYYRPSYYGSYYRPSYYGSYGYGYYGY